MTVRKVTKQKGEATRRYQVISLFFFVFAGVLCLLIAVYSSLYLLCFFAFYTFFDTYFVYGWT